MGSEQESLDESREERKKEVAKQRSIRHYKATILPFFKDGSQAPERQGVLLSLYAEICSSWRMLTDVRFKLPGRIPVVSVLVWIGLLFIARLANR